MKLRRLAHTTNIRLYADDTVLYVTEWEANAHQLKLNQSASTFRRSRSDSSEGSYYNLTVSKNKSSDLKVCSHCWTMEVCLSGWGEAQSLEVQNGAVQKLLCTYSHQTVLGGLKSFFLFYVMCVSHGSVGWSAWLLACCCGLFHFVALECMNDWWRGEGWTLNSHLCCVISNQLITAANTEALTHSQSELRVCVGHQMQRRWLKLF